jgi:hypothetical protein
MSTAGRSGLDRIIIVIAIIVMAEFNIYPVIVSADHYSL